MARSTNTRLWRLVNSQGDQIGPLHGTWHEANAARRQYAEGKRGPWKPYRLQQVALTVMWQEEHPT